MSKYFVFEICIKNAKNGKREYDEYSTTVRDAEGYNTALERVNNYVKERMTRYKAGSTYTIEKVLEL